MKKVMKIVVALVLVAALVTGLCCTLVGCDNDGPKRAVIMVTALFSGGLYDKSTDTPVWDPFCFTDIDMKEIFEVLNEGIFVEGKELDVENLDECLTEGAQTLVQKAMNTKVGDDEWLSYMLSEIVSPTILEYPSSAEGKADYDNESNLLWKLTLNQDGSVRDENIVPSNGFDNPIQYGVLAAYREHVNALSDKYDCESVVFNYDWRLSGKYNSGQLEKFINDNGYDEVVLMSHSLGGQICAGYLARSEANRNKVKAYCPFAPAFLGATMALIYLNNMYDVMDMFATLNDDNTTNVSTLKGADDFLAGGLNFIMEDLARPFLENMTGIIQLVPSFAFCQQYKDSVGAWPIKNELGEDCDSEDKLFAYYESRHWAFETDENGNAIVDASKANTYGYNAQGYKLKTEVAALRDFQHSLYVDNDGTEGINTLTDAFAPTLVNTYYFVGENKDTMTCYDGSKLRDENGWQDVSLDNAYSLALGSVGKSGDGTVPYYSAFGGHDEAELDAIHGERHYFIYHNQDHGNVGINWELLKDNVYSVIDALEW